MANLEVFEVDAKSNQKNLVRLKGVGRSGASKTVFEHPIRANVAIAIYDKRSERNKFEKKIRAMLRVRYKRPDVSQFDLGWPESLIVDGAGTFLGFTMPFYGTGWLLLDSLLQAAEAERKFGFGDSARLKVVRNIATAVKYLHGLGIYCIDLKPQNMLVNMSNHSVAIIDCDGMSILDISQSSRERYTADKSTDEFWAPENIGLKPESFSNSDKQDRFALAVISFMILNRGIHPFQGEVLTKINGAEDVLGKIANGLYPHSPGQSNIKEHPDTLYHFWPHDLCEYFDRSFTRGRERPTAGEWQKLFAKLISQASACNQIPKLHLRFSDVDCPVCTRNRKRSARQINTKKIGATLLRGMHINNQGTQSPITGNIGRGNASKKSTKYGILPFAALAILILFVSWIFSSENKGKLSNPNVEATNQPSTSKVVKPTEDKSDSPTPQPKVATSPNPNLPAEFNVTVPASGYSDPVYFASDNCVAIRNASNVVAFVLFSGQMFKYVKGGPTPNLVFKSKTGRIERVLVQASDINSSFCSQNEN